MKSGASRPTAERRAASARAPTLEALDMIVHTPPYAPARHRARAWIAHVLLATSLLLIPDRATGNEPGRDTAAPHRVEDDATTPVGRRPEVASPSLVRRIGSDFKNVFTTKENLLTVGVGGVAALIAHQWDDEIAAGSLNSELDEDTALDATFESGQIVGGGAVQVGGAFIVFGAGKVFEKPGVEVLGRDLVRAQIVTQSITFAMKLAFGRERPEDPSNTLSFPSGHSSGTFATATVLQRHYGWKVGVPSYAIAAYVAASRLSEARHYLSDVVFGAAVGIVGGYTVTLGLKDERFGVAPLPPATGWGLKLTWSGSCPPPSR